MKSILAVDNILDWSSSRYRLSLSWMIFHSRFGITHKCVDPRGIYHPFAAGTHQCILVAKDQRIWLNVWHNFVCQEKSSGSPHAMRQVPEKCSIYWMKMILASIFLRSHNSLIHFVANELCFKQASLITFSLVEWQDPCNYCSFEGTRSWRRWR